LAAEKNSATLEKELKPNIKRIGNQVRERLDRWNQKVHCLGSGLR
jgi:hypothetical protein